MCCFGLEGWFFENEFVVGCGGDCYLFVVVSNFVGDFVVIWIVEGVVWFLVVMMNVVVVFFIFEGE